MLCFTSIIYGESSRRLRSFESHHSENIHQKRCQVPSAKISFKPPLKMLQVNSLAYSYAPYLGELNFKLLYFIRRKLCFSHFMFWNLKKKKLYIFVVYLCDIITREKETKLQKKNKNEIDESGNTTILHLNANFEHLFWALSFYFNLLLFISFITVFSLSFIVRI